MKTIDILKQKHTALINIDGYTEHQGLTDYTQSDRTLNEILFGIGKLCEKNIGLLRQQEYHSDEYNRIKNDLPCWFVGGTFPKPEVKNGRLVTYTDDEYINTYSNILCIDIDNQDIDRQTIFNLPYVFAVLRSCGGRGYYVLILVEDGKYTKEYYSYLAKVFKMKFNINIDTQCKNIGRKRVISYEDNIWQWIKPLEQEITSWKLKDTTTVDDLFENKSKRFIDYKPQKNNNNNNNIDFVRKAIWKLLDNGFSIDDYSKQSKNYGAWFHTACEFAHFDDGYEMFVRFSQNSTKYNDDIKTINKKWNNADKNKSNIDDVCRKWCGMCKKRYGVNWWKD